MKGDVVGSRNPDGTFKRMLRHFSLETFNDGWINLVWWKRKGVV